jgi:hypothetical protein
VSHSHGTSYICYDCALGQNRKEIFTELGGGTKGFWEEMSWMSERTRYGAGNSIRLPTSPKAIWGIVLNTDRTSQLYLRSHLIALTLRSWPVWPKVIYYK